MIAIPSQIKVALRLVAIAALLSTSLLGVGCGGGDDGSERAVEWMVERRLGPKQVRLSADIEFCSVPPRLERPIVEYKGDRVYVELRVTPEVRKEGQNGCFLGLLILHKKITLERDLDELTLVDASTDPPEQRWPRQR